MPNTVVDGLGEGIPVPVQLNATKLDDGLGAFTNPSHPALMPTLADDVLDRTFDCTVWAGTANDPQ